MISKKLRASAYASSGSGKLLHRIPSLPHTRIRDSPSSTRRIMTYAPYALQGTTTYLSFPLPCASLEPQDSLFHFYSHTAWRMRVI